MTTEIDFLIIGGGIAGTSAAYYFAAHGRTIVLEQEDVAGYHSTGRSAAIFSEYHGPRLICRLARASYNFFANPPEGFSDTPILHDKGMLFTGTKEEMPMAKSMLAESQSSGNHLELLCAAQVKKLVPFMKDEQSQTAIYYPGAQEIDVAALHQGWIRGLKKQGGTLETGVRIDSIHHDENGWTLETNKGTYVARTLINAAGAWADKVAEMAGVAPLGLIPKRRTVITVDLPEDHQNKSYPMVISLDQKFYFKTEKGRLIASPMDTTPVEPQDIQPEEIDIATAAWLLQERTTLPVDRVHGSWAGLRSFLGDDAPAVGPDPQMPDFIWLAGQGGYGIKTCEAMARACVSLTLNGTLPEDITALGIDAAMLAPGRTYGKKTSLIA